MPGLDDDLRAAAHGWAEEGALAQGLGPTVGGEVLASVALLLGVKPSGAPDGAQARVVELARAAHSGGADVQVIEDGGDDLLLAS